MGLGWVPLQKLWSRRVQDWEDETKATPIKNFVNKGNWSSQGWHPSESQVRAAQQIQETMKTIDEIQKAKLHPELSRSPEPAEEIEWDLTPGNWVYLTTTGQCRMHNLESIRVKIISSYSIARISGKETRWEPGDLIIVCEVETEFGTMTYPFKEEELSLAKKPKKMEFEAMTSKHIIISQATIDNIRNFLGIGPSPVRMDRVTVNGEVVYDRGERD